MVFDEKRANQLNSNWRTICTLVEMLAADGKTRSAVAGYATRELELKTGQKVVTSQNYLTEQEKKKNNLITAQSVKRENK